MMTVASGRNYYQLSEPISVSFVLHCAQSPCRDTCADTRACISSSRYPTLSARAAAALPDRPPTLSGSPFVSAPLLRRPAGLFDQTFAAN